MRAKIKDMTSGKPLPLIVSFALPLMVGNIFQQLYTVVDTMVVGKALGVDALAALGATDWLYWMWLGMIQGVTQGFGILMAREFGAKQFESLRSVVGSSVTLSALSSVLFLILGQAAAEPILNLLNTPPEIMGGSLLYLRIMFLGIPIVMAYNLLATVLRSLGDGQTPLYATRGIYLTTSYFHPNAWTLIQKINNVTAIDGKRLFALAKECSLMKI